MVIFGVDIFSVYSYKVSVLMLTRIISACLALRTAGISYSAIKLKH